ncbi:MAG: choice-of-anchor Q domain-containing protein [Lysobacteraceae bacterium]
MRTVLSTGHAESCLVSTIPHWPARLCVLLLGLFALTAQAQVCRVTESGSGDGSSWALATDLQSALGNAACEEIWVAAGFYTPTSGTDRTISFHIDRDLQLYGGFAGGEASLAERVLNPANPSILSGDIDGNDTGAGGINASWADIVGSNSHHVVFMQDTGSTPISSATVIDGFVITGGAADGVAFPHSAGGGLFCRADGANTQCSPTLRQLRISGNWAGDGSNSGGGMYNEALQLGATASATLTDVLFNGNSAYRGGGLSNRGNDSGNASPTLNRVSFDSNRAWRLSGSQGDGGGMRNFAEDGTASPQLTNVSFSGNTASAGAGLRNEYYGDSGTAHPVLRNVSFVGNSAVSGGGIHQGGDWFLAMTLDNVILWGNTATASGAQVSFQGTVTINNSVVQDGCDDFGGGGTVNCSNIITTNPLLGTMQDNGGFTPTMLPAAGSSAINTGDSGTCPAEDQRGVARPQGAACDIGAVEVVPDRPLGACLVDDDAPGIAPGDGESWASAYHDLQDALADTTCAEIWVAAGFYTPTSGTDRTISFHIDRDLQLYGGFAGSEASLAERVLNPASPSILSGDIDGNDTDTDGNRINESWNDIQGANSHNVIRIEGTSTPITSNTIVDGFVVTGGSADGPGYTSSGGGLQCLAVGAGTQCSPVISRMHFTGNTATELGGGFFVIGSDGGVSSPILTQSTLSGNSAQAGGGLHNHASAAGSSTSTIRNSTFSGNSATGGGGLGNAIEGIGTAANAVLSQVTFNDNSSSDQGGAIFNANPLSGNTALLSLQDVILWDNPSTNGDAFYSIGQSVTTLDGSVVQGGCPGAPPVYECSNLTDSDPLLGPMQNNGGFTPTLLPAAGSSAIDAGSAGTCPAEDQRGVARPQGSGCDIGAVEVAQASLDVMVTGQGQVDADATPLAHSGSIAACTDSSGDCSAFYTPNDVVTLTATPATDWHFVSWGGDCSGTANPTTVTLDDDRSCTASFAINQFTVTPVVTSGDGSISPNSAQVVDAGSSTAFDIIPATGWSIGGVGSTCPGSMSGLTFTAGPIVADCTLEVGFARLQYGIGGTVSGLVGSGLELLLTTTPPVARGSGALTLPISANGGFSFPVLLDFGTGYVVSVAAQPGSPAQTCSIANASGTLGAAPVSNIAVTCATDTHTVDAVVASGNGSVDPATQVIADGGSATITVTPDANWHIDTVTGCGGTLSGNSYSTGTITADCTVEATFAIDQHSVTPTVIAGNGSISPDTPQTVDGGTTTSFTLTPDANWHIDTVTGCGGSLSGNTYSTGSITADCTVEASFALGTVSVGAVVSGGNGSIDPPNADVPYGDTQVFTITPDSGYVIASVSGCGGTLVGDVYTTAPITSACSVVVAFGFATPAAVAAPELIPASDWRSLLLLIGIMGLFAGVALRRR